MRLSWVALLIAAPLLSHAQDRAGQQLSLDDAFVRVAQDHPELRLFGPQTDILIAEQARAALRPDVLVGASVENAFGTGSASGLDQAELTLSLASVLERGGKLDARRALAQTRIDALSVERETRRLDLLAEVARRYLAIVVAEQEQDIAQIDIGQRQRTVAGAKHRLQAGASPPSVVFAAQAALARAELDHARAKQNGIAARQHLAALWGERDPQFGVAAIDPWLLPEIASFSDLTNLLERTPELTQFAGERRIREARLQLARTQATADLDWQIGVRRLQETDDTALIGSISMPLGASRRAQPDIQVADAELTSLEIEREAKGLSLYSTLAEAYGRYQVARLEVGRLHSEVLPLLAKAERAAEQAYRAGAISYLEWAQLQSERTNMRKQQLDAAVEAQRALIEIQRLTGQPFLASKPHVSEGVSP